jgi:hypothetical protein
MQTTRRYPLVPASAAAILGIDWLVHLLSDFYALELVNRPVVWGAAFCGVVVFLVENVARPSSTGLALAKGAIVVGAIAVPGPLLGTTFAVFALAWWAAAHLSARFDRRSR